MSTISVSGPRPSLLLKYTKKTVKRVAALAAGIYFIPKLLLFWVACGVADLLRNRPFELSRFTRYFAGKGVFTWVLSPFNLIFDLISLPYWNKGIYRMQDLPQRYQTEIQTLIDACHKRDLIGSLE